MKWLAQDLQIINDSEGLKTVLSYLPAPVIILPNLTASGLVLKSDYKILEHKFWKLPWCLFSAVNLKGVEKRELELVRLEAFEVGQRESNMMRKVLKGVLSWPLENTGVLCSKELN